MGNTHCGKHDKIVADGKTCPGCDTEAQQAEEAQEDNGKKKGKGKDKE